MSPSAHRGATTSTAPPNSSVPGSHGAQCIDSGASPGLIETQRSAKVRREKKKKERRKAASSQGLVIFQCLQQPAKCLSGARVGRGDSQATSHSHLARPDGVLSGRQTPADGPLQRTRAVCTAVRGHVCSVAPAWPGGAGGSRQGRMQPPGVCGFLGVGQGGSRGHPRPAVGTQVSSQPTRTSPRGNGCPRGS